MRKPQTETNDSHLRVIGLVADLSLMPPPLNSPLSQSKLKFR